MRYFLPALLPALALLALGGCAGTSTLTSSEDDGVYYSSKDRTTAVVSPAPDPASTDEAANPDYNGNTANSPARQGRGSTQYYDNTYTYMRGVPGYGLSYYTPYSPYTSLSYGWGSGFYGVSPFYGGFYDPFYSSFYSPWGYGYGSGLSISFGFGIGRPWGYGYGFGRPYGFGYGYGGGFYDPYYFNSPFYGGYYGRGGFYGNSYYGSTYRSNWNYGDNGNGRYRTSGHRSDRASDGRYLSGGTSTPTGSGTGSGGISGGRGRTNGLMAPSTPMTEMTSVTKESQLRQRSETAISASPAETLPATVEGYNQPHRRLRSEQPTYRDMPQLQEDQQPASTWKPQGGRRRDEIIQQADVDRAPSNPGGQTADQPSRQRSYDQPRRQRSFDQSYDQLPQQQSYEQPRQRSYEQPRQPSYEQPQRSYSQPSYSAPAPSYNGGGGGGGHSRGRSN
ncbi:hypothetical protein IC235_14505 [Hymenobacter sp. BT664]|uniref:Prolyl-tRNA synthetase n=1 Tax=Hymenobacter montanus TaxID=2771359 RepID=A0A927BE13_9BACT|nr:hypothetical protein [Hymenobacter montanus]MBD2769102.1 hypothetical protein [Hymenobacter montanus]